MRIASGDAGGGAGGEYATQIGFGWTNGVLRKLMTMYLWEPVGIESSLNRMSNDGTNQR